MTFEKLGQAREAADAMIAEGAFTAQVAAGIYTWLGDRDAAFRVLETVHRSGELSLIYTGVDPALAPLRDDHVQPPPVEPQAPRGQRVVDVRFGDRYGLKSDIATSPKNAKLGRMPFVERHCSSD